MVLLPDDPEARRRCYKNALSNWRYRDYVRFKERVLEWLRIECPEYGNIAVEIARRLHEYVNEQGGDIDEQEERRPEWDDHEFHFDLRVEIDGRHLYFETLLFCDNPDDVDDPFIEVVSVHDV